MRLTSDFWVAALIRQVRAEGAFAYLTRRGALEAGAIFIQRRHADGLVDLYGPAPQSAYRDEKSADERLFIALLQHQTEDHSVELLQKELRFDPDIWLVEIEDYNKDKLPFTLVDALG